MTEERNWWEGVRKELTPRRDLLLLKAVIALHTLGMYCALPYIALHLFQLGLTYQEMGIVVVFLPIPALLGPSISGMIADKTGCYKAVLCGVMIIAGLFFLPLLVIPARPMRRLTLTCDSSGHNLTWSTCDLCHQHRNNTLVNLTFKKCKSTCPTNSSNIRMCLAATDDIVRERCLFVNDELKINGTVLSTMEGDTCSHTMSQVFMSEKVLMGPTCPATCPVQCQVIDPPRCSDPDDPSNNTTTFWAYLAIRNVWYFFMVASFSMMDAVTLTVIKERGAEFGHQETASIVAKAVAPPVSGALVDWWSQDKEMSDYSPAIILAVVLVVPAALLVTCLTFKVEATTTALLKDLKQIVSKKDVNGFLFLVFILGSNWGFFESFHFVYLKTLNASNYLLGLSMTMSYVTCVPVIYLADKIINKLGSFTLFGIAFFVYSIREFAFSFIRNPWLAVPLEMLEVFSSNLPWVAMIKMCPVLAPKGLLATMTGILSPIHFAFGRAAGGFVGGFLVTAKGLAGAYRLFSYINLGCGCIYFVIYGVFLKSRVDKAV